MSFLDFIPLIGKLLDRVLPDKAAAEAAKLKVLELAQQGQLAELNADLEMATGQLEVNKVEAANPSVFVSGWRPFVGWTCAAGMASQFVVGPLFSWGSALAGHPTPWPEMDLSTMLPLLGGLLGLGAMRTSEKIKGVARV
jgi:hypothetical protein